VVDPFLSPSTQQTDQKRAGVITQNSAQKKDITQQRLEKDLKIIRHHLHAKRMGKTSTDFISTKISLSRERVDSTLFTISQILFLSLSLSVSLRMSKSDSTNNPNRSFSECPEYKTGSKGQTCCIPTTLSFSSSNT